MLGSESCSLILSCTCIIGSSFLLFLYDYLSYVVCYTHVFSCNSGEGFFIVSHTCIHVCSVHVRTFAIASLSSEAIATVTLKLCLTATVFIDSTLRTRCIGCNEVCKKTFRGHYNKYMQELNTVTCTVSLVSWTLTGRSVGMVC